jgi:hypothetical protein
LFFSTRSDFCDVRQVCGALGQVLLKHCIMLSLQIVDGQGGVPAVQVPD